MAVFCDAEVDVLGRLKLVASILGGLQRRCEDGALQLPSDQVREGRGAQIDLMQALEALAEDALEGAQQWLQDLGRCVLRAHAQAEHEIALWCQEWRSGCLPHTPLFQDQVQVTQQLGASFRICIFGGACKRCPPETIMDNTPAMHAFQLWLGAAR